MATGPTGSKRDYGGSATRPGKNASRPGKEERLESMDQPTSIVAGDPFTRRMGWYSKQARPESAVGGVLASTLAWIRGRPVGQG